jgi:hypothetical protein
LWMVQILWKASVSYNMLHDIGQPNVQQLHRRSVIIIIIMLPIKP